MISGIQHFVFCRRQWSLIHIEQAWEENYFTVDGLQKHKRVDDSKESSKRNGVIEIRALPIKSHELRIIGVCDVIELRPCQTGAFFHKYRGNYEVFPVEYKRGRPKIMDADRLQLCAQALCLEEMLSTNIKEGAIFYFESRRREIVEFTPQLRNTLRSKIGEMHEYYAKGLTPIVKKRKKCSSCSLKNKCFIELDYSKSANEYINKVIEG